MTDPNHLARLTRLAADAVGGTQRKLPPEIRALAQAINEVQRREIAEMAKLSGGSGHHH